MHFRWSKRFVCIDLAIPYPACLRDTQLSGEGRKKPHTLWTVHSDIEEACQSLEAQIAEIEQQNRDVLREVQDVVGALSDLRHGRFPASTSGDSLGEEVTVALRQLETVCGKPTG